MIFSDQNQYRHVRYDSEADWIANMQLLLEVRFSSSSRVLLARLEHNRIICRRLVQVVNLTLEV